MENATSAKKDYSKLTNKELRIAIAQALGFELDGALPLWGTVIIDGVKVGCIIPNYPEDDTAALETLKSLVEKEPQLEVSISHETLDGEYDLPHWFCWITRWPSDEFAPEEIVTAQGIHPDSIARAAAEAILEYLEATKKE